MSLSGKMIYHDHAVADDEIDDFDNCHDNSHKNCHNNSQFAGRARRLPRTKLDRSAGEH